MNYDDFDCHHEKLVEYKKDDENEYEENKNEK